MLPKYICTSSPVLSSNSSLIFLTACLSPFVCIRDISNLNIGKTTLLTCLHKSSCCPFSWYTTTIFLTSHFGSHPVKNLRDNFYGAVFKVCPELDRALPLPLCSGLYYLASCCRGLYLSSPASPLPHILNPTVSVILVNL